MKLELLATTGKCTNGAGGCPSVYRTDRGTYLVQGYIVTDAEALAQAGIPPGESIVEVPAEVLGLAKVR